MKQEQKLPKGIEIAQRVAVKAKEKFRTQAEFAAATGITQTAVSYYFTAKRVPSAENLPAIANALGVSIEWILTGHGPAAGAEAAEEWRLRALAAEQKLTQVLEVLRKLSSIDTSTDAEALAALRDKRAKHPVRTESNAEV